MNLAKKTLSWLVVGAVSLALVTSAEAQMAKQRTGKVVRIKGAARYSTGNNIWQPLKVGTILRAGAIVQTAQSSYADVVVNEESSAPAARGGSPSKRPSSASASKSSSSGSAAARSVDQDVIRILEDSVLSFDRLTAVDTGADRVTETELDLRTGAIFAAVKKQAAASRFEIKIPNGVAGIRGTHVFANAAKSTFACIDGSLVAAYTNQDGTPGTQLVGGGFQFNCQTRELASLTPGAITAFDPIIAELTSATAGAAAPTALGQGIQIDETIYPVSTSSP